MSKKLIVLTMATVLVAGLITAGATASGKQSSRQSFSVGIYDDGMTVGNPEKGFPILKNLRAQLVRVTLWWGGPIGVARAKRPTTPTNPADPAYNWSNYDRAVQMAAKYKIKVLFSIVGTPSWANGGKGQRIAPTRPIDLKNFATAAARRYSGTFKDADETSCRPSACGSPGTSRTTRCSSLRSTRRSAATTSRSARTTTCGSATPSTAACTPSSTRLRRSPAAAPIRAATTSRRAGARRSRRLRSCVR